MTERKIKNKFRKIEILINKWYIVILQKKDTNHICLTLAF